MDLPSKSKVSLGNLKNSGGYRVDVHSRTMKSGKNGI
jgi:hypothetical protein